MSICSTEIQQDKGLTKEDKDSAVDKTLSQG